MRRLKLLLLATGCSLLGAFGTVLAKWDWSFTFAAALFVLMSFRLRCQSMGVSAAFGSLYLIFTLTEIVANWARGNVAATRNEAELLALLLNLALFLDPMQFFPFVAPICIALLCHGLLTYWINLKKEPC